MDERVERTAETYEAVAEQYESLHGDRSDVADIVEGFSQRVRNGASRESPPDDGRLRVLDAGCGPGWEAATFAAAGFDVVGLDLTREFLASGRERAPTAAFVRGDVRTLPVAADAMDGVFSLASLLHVPSEDLDDVLAEFARVTRSGGVLTISTKQSATDLADSPYDDDRRHVETYEPAALRDRLERAGFAIDDLEAEERWVVVHAARE